MTNLDDDAATLYDPVYCQRGEAENRIKEAQVGLFATRTSCHVFASNPLRVLLAALAYVLIKRMRALALQGTELANAQIDTLRIRLLKLAAVVTRNTRRIRLYFASNWPSAAIFTQAMRALSGTQQIHPVHGHRVDSSQARNPSRGRAITPPPQQSPPCRASAEAAPDPIPWGAGTQRQAEGAGGAGRAGR